jgi:uncharacterized membrane protein YhaH (DUF805 family)
MTEAPNPYTPPRAEVDDIHSATGETQDVKVWSAGGRIGRLRYLGYNIAAGLVLGAVSVVLAAVFGAQVAIAITMLLYIPLVVLGVLTLIQRAHDMGWSGWTCFLVIIPFVAFVWLFKAGTPGENRYGAPPPPNPVSIKVLGLWVPVGMFVIGLLAAIFAPRGAPGGF